MRPQDMVTLCTQDISWAGPLQLACWALPHDGLFMTGMQTECDLASCMQEAHILSAPPQAEHLHTT